MIFKVLIIFTGIFSIVASLFNWDWFFNNPRAQFFIRLFGNSRRNGRIFYVILGIVLCILGLSFSE